MQSKLLQFINSLSLEQNDKDYLKLLIKEEQESLLEGMVDYAKLQITNYELREGNVANLSNLTNLSNLSNKAEGGSAGAEAMADGASQSVDAEVKNLDGVLDYGDGVYDKAEETYNKVILSLKKNDKWLSKLIIKVQKSNEEIKDKFVKLLQDARTNLANIRVGMDQSWQDFDRKKHESDHTLGTQVASIKDEFRGGDHDLEKNIVEFIGKLCSQYRDKIDNMSKAFSNHLDSAAKQIDNLTNETSDKMRDVINEREQKKLRDKIMGK